MKYLFLIIFALVIVLCINRFYINALGEKLSQSFSLELNDILNYKIGELASVIPVHQFIFINNDEISSHLNCNLQGDSQQCE